MRRNAFPTLWNAENGLWAPMSAARSTPSSAPADPAMRRSAVPACHHCPRPRTLRRRYGRTPDGDDVALAHKPTCLRRSFGQSVWLLIRAIHHHCDGHHEMSDLGADGDPDHSHDATTSPVW